MTAFSWHTQTHTHTHTTGSSIRCNTENNN